MGKGNSIIQWITVLTFFTMLSFPLVNSYLGLVDELEVKENRKLKERPEFDINDLDSYTEDFDDYYSDNFSTRNQLVKWSGFLDYSVFKVSPTPRVIVGKDGWFYNKLSLPYYECASRYSDAELDSIKAELMQRSKWCKERDMQFYVAVIPNKMNMYPDDLPRTVIKKNETGKYEQIISLNDDTTLRIIDVKKDLQNNLDHEHKLYQVTDDHWNSLGAFYGYRSIMDRLQIDFPQLEPQKIENYSINTYEKLGTMAEILGLNQQFPEQFVDLVKKTKTNAVFGEEKGYPSKGGIDNGEHEIVYVNKDGKKLKCLIIRDSFSIGLMKFFKEDFETLVLIHDIWRYRLRQDILEQENPDIVITIMVENFLDKFLQNPSF